jgi:Mg-chelatase subunit ChlD
MDLWLVQGEDPDPLRCHVLGHFEFFGIPHRPAGQSQLQVTFRYNSNGIVEVEANDMISGQTLSHRMAAGHMTLEDIAANRVPMQIALVIDCSGSMYGTCIREARKAAKAFVHRTLQRNREFAVVAFPGGVKTAPTNQIDRIEAAIDSLSPIGSTPMQEGMRRARDILNRTGNIQKVILVLTDGHPDDPEAAAAEAHRIRQDRGRVVVVGVGRQVDRAYLQRLCSSPSDYHHVNQSIDLESTFANLATQLAPSPQEAE